MQKRLLRGRDAAAAVLGLGLGPWRVGFGSGAIDQNQLRGVAPASSRGPRLVRFVHRHPAVREVL